VVIAPADGMDQEWIKELQREPDINLVARVGAHKRGAAAVAELRPHVLVIDRTVEEIEEVLNALYPVAPQTLCLGVLPGEDMASVRRLMAAGARDILFKPLTAKELMSSLRQVVEIESARRESAGLPPLLAERQATGAPKVILVRGAKGGAGTTTVATNLAVALKQATGSSVALVDFNMQFGDVAVLLNVRAKHTLEDLATHYQTLDASLLERVLAPHSSGIKVVQALSEPEQAGELSGEHASAIVDGLRAQFAYIVIDTWPFLDETTDTLMAAADQVLLVITPEVAALKNARQALEYWKRHGVPHDHVAVVLTRFPGLKGITLKAIEEHLRRPVQATIPDDYLSVTYAANRGVPLVQSYPDSWVAQSMRKLAAWVAGGNVQTISQARPQAPRRWLAWRAGNQ